MIEDGKNLIVIGNVESIVFNAPTTNEFVFSNLEESCAQIEIAFRQTYQEAENFRVVLEQLRNDFVVEFSRFLFSQIKDDLVLSIPKYKEKGGSKRRRRHRGIGW